MNNVVRMCFRQPSRHLLRSIQDFGEFHRSAEMNSLRQRLAVIERHYDEPATVACRLDTVDRADVGMVEGGGHASFLEKSLLLFLAGSDFFRKELERYCAFQLNSPWCKSGFVGKKHL